MYKRQAEELEDCRRSLLSGMAGIEDTLGGIETWYYMEVLRGGPVQTPDDARAALQAVTEEDVRTVLRQLTLSVSYLLTREEESAHALSLIHIFTTTYKFYLWSI